MGKWCSWMASACLALWTGCPSHGGRQDRAPREDAGPQTDDGAREPDAVAQRVAALLAEMTLEEKVSQMHGAGGAQQGIWWTPAVERLGIPAFGMVDGPRGVSAATGSATTFPVASARGATWDPALERRVGAAIGLEARARGANVLLAPAINLLRHPRWGRAQETYGEDPHLLGALGAAFIEGAQQHVITSVKHYALNSIEDTRFQVDVRVDERTLREVYLPHFRRAVEAGAGAVMSAYNSVNGLHCDENDHLLRDILKGEWGFAGFVVSDWVFGTHSTVGSSRAGLDVEMPAASKFGPALVRAVGEGQVDEAVIDEAAGRVLATKLRFGLFDPATPPDPEVIESDEHVALALQVARRSLVLLKNDAGALPFDRAGVKRVALVGPLVDVANLGDTGSSAASPSDAVTPLEGLRRVAGEGIELVVPADPAAPTDAETEAIASADAVVLLVGLDASHEGEHLLGAGDREDLALPADQVALVQRVAARHERVVVVLEGGSAVLVEPWIDQVQALVMAWYPGMEGGQAIAEALFGDLNPSGRLPVTFPRSEDDLPPFVNDQDQVEYGYLHGYRALDRTGRAPRFAFGFGLSYTSFALSDLQLEADAIAPDGQLVASVQVENTGQLPGEHVVQLYVSYPESQVERAPRELKAFARVALAPGERQRVTLRCPAQGLGWYDPSMGRWRVDTQRYDVHVGASSRDLPLSASVRVAASP